MTRLAHTSISNGWAHLVRQLARNFWRVWTTDTSTDEQILQDLARPEGATPEDQQAFMDGLGKVVLSAQAEGKVDLTDIATAIAAYRHDFAAARTQPM